GTERLLDIGEPDERVRDRQNRDDEERDELDLGLADEHQRPPPTMESRIPSRPPCPPGAAPPPVSPGNGSTDDVSSGSVSRGLVRSPTIGRFCSGFCLVRPRLARISCRSRSRSMYRFM